jgi:hypothetical protein
MTDFVQFPNDEPTRMSDIVLWRAKTLAWKQRFVAQLEDIRNDPLAKFGLHEQTKELIKEILEVFK